MINPFSNTLCSALAVLLTLGIATPAAATEDVLGSAYKYSAADNLAPAQSVTEAKVSSDDLTRIAELAKYLDTVSNRTFASEAADYRVEFGDSWAIDGKFLLTSAEYDGDSLIYAMTYSFYVEGGVIYREYDDGDGVHTTMLGLTESGVYYFYSEEDGGQRSVDIHDASGRWTTMGGLLLHVVSPEAPSHKLELREIAEHFESNLDELFEFYPEDNYSVVNVEHQNGTRITTLNMNIAGDDGVAFLIYSQEGTEVKVVLRYGSPEEVEEVDGPEESALYLSSIDDFLVVREEGRYGDYENFRYYETSTGILFKLSLEEWGAFGEFKWPRDIDPASD